MINDTKFDVLKIWLNDNYPYIVAAMQKTNKERENIFRLAEICKNHGVSFKTFLDIGNEWNEVLKN